MSSRRPLARLFPVLLLNLIAFGIAIPVLPALALALGATEFEVGLLFSTQALGQFIAAPIFGGLSDRFGRKPLLIVSLIAATVFEAATAIVTDLPTLWIVRFCVGITAANVATASALIADATDAETRSRGMALIGVSFGVGFTIGPALGAVISKLARPGLGALGIGLPFLAAAALTGVTTVLAAGILVEPTRAAAQRIESRVRISWDLLGRYLRRPGMRMMCGLFLLYTLAASILEGTYFLYAARRYGWGQEEVGYTLGALGLLMAALQGGVGRIAAAVGERWMTAGGTALMGLGLILAPLGSAVWPFLVFLGLATAGRALTHTGIYALTSRQSRGPAETGRVMGVLQSSGSFARIFGPALGGYLIDTYWVGTPFVFAGALLLVGITWWWWGTRSSGERAGGLDIS